MKIDDKTRELIAIGASITANCQPCLQYHVAQGRRLGAADEEIAAAIEIGRQVRRGAGVKMDGFASKLAGITVGAAAAADCCVKGPAPAA